MDLQKEREAFEAIAENIRLLRGAKFKDGEYVALSLFDESSKELAAQLNYGWAMWLAAKAQAEGFVLVSAEQMSQWGRMANYAEQYGCPECYEARGYAHSLACEINEFLFAIEAQEPAND